MTLLPAHRKHLRTSGLSDETIAAAGISSVTDPGLAGKILGWSGPGPAPAIRFPHLGSDGSEYLSVLRPDRPVIRGDGSAPKYESPMGMPPRLYFAPGVPGWSGVKPLIIVEGIKKALAAIQAGVLAVSAQGVTVWHDIEYKSKTGLWRLHPDFLRVSLKSRAVYIAFDGGDTTVNSHVIKAEARLAQLLCEAGADVRLLRIPCPDDGSKVGLDDYLVTQADPSEALQRLLVEARPGDIVARIRAIESTSDRPLAGIELLRDWSAVAAIDVASEATRDVAQAELRRLCKINKAAVAEAIAQFHKTFREKNDDPDVAPIDPDTLAEAEELLRDPALVPRLMAHLQLEGLVEEQAGAFAILLAGVSRLLSKPINLVVKSCSSSGKNYMAGIVVSCFPPSEIIEMTDMSPRALNYMTESIRHKIVLITETEGAERAQYALRAAMSEGRTSTYVVQRDERTGEMQTRRHDVEGPTCFVVTTTASVVHDENETRMLEISLDESSDQTGRIIGAQGRDAAQPRTTTETASLIRARTVVQTALGLLQPCEVAVPQAEQLAASYPVTAVRRRRDFTKLITLIRAHALLHQRQRQMSGEFLRAEDADVEAARAVSRALEAEDLAPRLVALADALRSHFAGEFSVAEAARALGQHPDAVRRRLQELSDAELAEVAVVGAGCRPSRWRIARQRFGGMSSNVSDSSSGLRGNHTRIGLTDLSDNFKCRTIRQ